MINMNNFRIYQHNIQGFIAKQDLLYQNLKNNQYPHIVLFQECFKSKNHVNNNILPCFYNTYSSITGRALILCRNELYVENITDKVSKNINNELFYTDNGFESIYLKIKITKDINIIISSCYRNPTKNLNEFNYSLFNQELVEARKISKYIIIGGDFNAYNPVWGSNKLDLIGETIYDICSNNSFKINEFNTSTFRDANENTVAVLDLVIYTKETEYLLNYIKIDEDDYYIGSDHKPITYSLNNTYYTDNIINSTHFTWNFNTNKINEANKVAELYFHNLLKQLPTNYENNIELLNKTITKWNNIIIQVTKEVFGEKEVSNRSRIWWTSRLSRLRNKSRKLERIYRYTKKEEDKFKWKTKYKQYKSELYNNKIKAAEKISNSLDTKNIKKLFNKYKNYTQKTIITMPSLIAEEFDNKVAYSIQEKAELYSKHVAEKIQHNYDNITEFETEINKYINDIYQNNKKDELEDDFMALEEDIDKNNIIELSKFNINNKITINELNNAIKTTATWKATGPDKIHNFMLKYYGNNMKKSLLFIFNWCYSIGYFPEIWKKCNITPIPKEGRNLLLCSSWRPIALLSCVGKLFEKIISKRLLYYCNINKIISVNQAGFQANKKTYDLLLRLTESIYKAINHNSVLYSCFLDITAAYDSVWRNGLLYKLRKNIKLSGRIYWILESFLRNRQGKVVINNISSKYRDFNIGVPQGSCLSPLLFILFINDITQDNNLAKNVQAGQFADDIALWISSYNNNQNDMKLCQLQLQKTLDNIELWCNKWKLILSPKKTKYIIFKSGYKKNYSNISLKLCNNIIQQSKFARYLGIYFDENLNWNIHINKIYNNGMKKLGYLKLICNNKYGPKFYVYLLLYKMTIRSTIEYCSGIWNNLSQKNINILNSIQLKALQYGTGTFKTDNIRKLEIITNIEPLEYRRQKETIKIGKEAYIKSKQEPEHNLSKAYEIYKNIKISNNKYINSPLKLANMYEKDNKLPNIILPPKKDVKSPNNSKKIPDPTNSPWNLLYIPTINEILASINGTEALIWTDGSCYPNPGYGGSCCYIQLIKEDRIIKFSFNNIVNNIITEFKAVELAINDILHNYDKIYKNMSRIIILSDCKMVVESIKGIILNTKYYQNTTIIQKKILKLKFKPELYWIKAHIGTPGNEKADKIAKEIARKQYNKINNNKNDNILINNNNLIEYRYLSNYLDQIYDKKWRKEWHTVYLSKIKLKTTHYTQELLSSNKENMVMVFNSLKRYEISLLSQFLTGHNKLNQYLWSINYSTTKMCPNCKENKVETVKHYFFKCKRQNQHRKHLFNNIMNYLKIKSKKITLKLLLTGIYKKSTIKQRIKTVKFTLQYISKTRRFIK